MGNERPVVNLRTVGSRGEDAASSLLISKQYEILHRNWRVRFGEIDIVAMDPAGELVFVEVKKCRTSRFGTPESHVDRRKQAKLYRLAEAFLKFNKRPYKRCRFDVIAIGGGGSGTPFIRHIPNAFLKM